MIELGEELKMDRGRSLKYLFLGALRNSQATQALTRGALGPKCGAAALSVVPRPVPMIIVDTPGRGADRTENMRGVKAVKWPCTQRGKIGGILSSTDVVETH